MVAHHLRIWHGAPPIEETTEEHHRLHASAIYIDKDHSHYAAPTQPQTGHENQALQDAERYARHQHQAIRIQQRGKTLDYEQEALDSLARSWRLEDPSCAALALADAQVWATLHLAYVTKEARP